MKGKTMNVNSILNSSIKVLMITTLAIALCISAIFIVPPCYADDVTYAGLIDLPFSLNSNPTYTTFENGVVTNNDHSAVLYFSLLEAGLTSGSAITITGNIPILSNNSDYSSIGFRSYTDTSSYKEVLASLYPIKRTDTSVSVNASFTYTDDVSYIAVTTNSHVFSFDLSSVVLEGIILEDNSYESFERTITIRPGYVAYIETDGGTLDLTANFHEFSRFFRPLWDNGVRISFDGGLAPTSGTTFNNSFGSSIDWLKPASAPSNLLGQTMVGGKSYTAGLPEGGSNKCVVIYNPAYANADTIIGGGTPTIGPTITARFSNLISVNQYALQGDVTRTFEDGITVDSGSPNGYDEGYMYIPSANDPTSVVSDSDYFQFNLADNTSSPAISITAGGYNATADYGTTTAPEEAEKGIIGLLSRILQFLSSPITHIMNLFTAGGNFMAWLGQLWVWLPSDVGAILVDALIVLIVIGAIKFLWK